MIEVKIKIQERPAAEGRVGCQLDMTIESIRPASEEVQLAAMILQRMRELATQISQQEGVRMRIVETGPEPGKN